MWLKICIGVWAFGRVGVAMASPYADTPTRTHANTIFTAASGFEGFIYLIILLIWGVAQALKKGRQTGPTESTPGWTPEEPRQAPPGMPDDLRQMLENLTGQKFQSTPAPPPPIPRPVETRNRRAPPRRRAPAPAMPAPASRYQPQPEPVRIDQDLMHAADVHQLSRQLPHAVASALTLKGLTSSMRSVRMATASIGSGMPKAQYAGHIGEPALDLRDRETLRKAIIGRIILGPCKALESSPRPEM